MANHGDLFDGLRREHFRCIAVDPPWNHTTWSNKGRGRSPKYRTMSVDDLASLPIEAYAARDCHLFLWITGPFLATGVHEMLIRRWGFAVSSVAFVWLKPTRTAFHFGFPKLSHPSAFKMGMGKTTRQNAEFVILGRHGSPERLSAGVRQEIIEPAREHSRKPELFYQRVEEYCAGPRLELFARQRRYRWTTRGDEVEKFR